MDFLKCMKAMSDKNRLRILDLLMQSPLSVSDMAKIVGVSDSAISQHITVLKAADLIFLKQKDKHCKIYALNKKCIKEIVAYMQLFLKKGKNNTLVPADYKEITEIGV